MEVLKEKEGIVSNSPKACFKNNPCFWKERNSLFTAFIRVKCFSLLSAQIRVKCFIVFAF